jgi:hypothetical protein
MTITATAPEIEQQIQHHEERATYLDANPYVHTNMDEEEHRAEAKRLRILLPAVARSEQRAKAETKAAEEEARVVRVRQRRAHWGC